MSNNAQKLNVDDYPKIRLGVSGCVIGQKVRFDGGHKRHDFVLNRLSDWVEFVPFCPEVAAGLGVPRPTIRLAKVGVNIRVIGSKDPQLDVTEQLVDTSEKLAEQARDLTGFVFCAKSPTCGMERVKVYNEQGNPDQQTRSGIFAEQILKQYPDLPCEETGRLSDLLLRNSFLVRLFCYARWQEAIRDGIKPVTLINFHARHKYLLMAHSPEHYRQIGPLLADLKSQPITDIAQQYIGLLMAGLKEVATRKKHTNVLMHLQGYFKRDLSKADKAALTDMILRYQQGLLTLAAPLEILKHHLRHHPDDYLAFQYYFQPFPEALVITDAI